MAMKKIINVLGWILWAVIYTGIIVAVLYWGLNTQNWIQAWESFSILGKIGTALLIGGIAIVFTIIMLYAEMLFDALSAIILHSMLKSKKSLEDFKDKLVKENDT